MPIAKNVNILLTEFKSCIFFIIKYVCFYLPHTVDELKEHRGPVGIVVLVVPEADAVAELVPEAGPLLLDEDLEAGEGAVVGVQQQHGQGGQLRRPVPPVTAVDYHTGFVVFNLKRSEGVLVTIQQGFIQIHTQDCPWLQIPIHEKVRNHFIKYGTYLPISIQ